MIVSAHAAEQTMTLVIVCLGAWVVMTRKAFTIGMLVISSEMEDR